LFFRLGRIESIDDRFIVLLALAFLPFSHFLKRIRYQDIQHTRRKARFFINPCQQETTAHRHILCGFHDDGVPQRQRESNSTAETTS